MTKLKVYAEADSDTGYSSLVFFRSVMAILVDPRGWSRAGIQFQVARNSSEADLWIRLSSNPTVKKSCGFDRMSCAWVAGKRSHINLDRWMGGSDKSGLSIPAYRRYVINHEVGHLLGLHDDTSQGVRTTLAPVMVQHTLGTRGYAPNNRPRDDEILAVTKLDPARLRIGGQKKKSKKKA